MLEPPQLLGGSGSIERVVRFTANRSVWRRIADFFFGYDFFISYTWLDGTIYAGHLAIALGERGFDCFLDSQSYAKGDDWKAVGTAAIRRTSQLVLVGSPQVLQSVAVLHEVGVFTATGRKVIPIDFNGTLEDARLHGTPLAQFITTDVLRIKEPNGALVVGPSEATLADLQKAFVSRRQSAKRMRALQAVAGTLALLLVVSVGFWRLAERRRLQADIARNEAEAQRKKAVESQKVAETRRVEADAAKQLAEEQRDAATIRQLIAVSNQIRVEQPQRIELAALLAAEALRLIKTLERNDRTALPEASNALRESLGKLLSPVRSGSFRSLIKIRSALVGRESALLLNADEKRLWLFDAASGKTTILGNSPHIRSAALLAGGKAAVFCSSDRRLNLVTVESRSMRPLEGACEEVLGTENLFVSMTKDATDVYDLRGTKTASLPLGSDVGAELSPDGKYLVTWNPGGFEVWQTGDAKQLDLGFGPFHSIAGAIFSPDSKLLAVSGDVSDVQVVGLPGTRRDFTCLCGGSATAISPSGTFLATGGDATRIWSLKSNKIDLHIEDADFTEVGDGRLVNDVAFGLRSATIASAGDDQVLRFIDRRGTIPLIRYGVHPQGVENVMFAGTEARYLLSVDKRGVLRQWDIGNARGQIALSIGSPSAVDEIELSPNGRYVAAHASIEETFQNNEDTQDAHQEVELNRTVFLWDLQGSLQPTELKADDDVNRISFSSDGKYLRVENDGPDAYWQTSDLEEAADDDAKPAFVNTKRESLHHLKLSEDRRAALNVADCSSAGSLVRTNHTGTNACVVSPGGDYVATASGRTVTVWRISDLSKVASMTHEASVTFVGFHPSAPWLASGSEDGSVRIWNFDSEALLRDTCDIVHRNLTQKEWREYIGVGPPYRRLCPRLP